MHIKKRKIIITLLSLILFTIAALGVLVWGVNTLSQNQVLTKKIITSQISRLLDLNSDVQNPHAYLDWDLQYKIKADKLTFIQGEKDLISVENLELKVFVPYLLLRKIYITEMNGNNMYVDFVRSKDNKINIIEIFNITGFFKVYFHNSAINVHEYFFNFTDEYHTPNEKIVVKGNDILLNKFTKNKYLQLNMDGNIMYKKTETPFLIAYNAKIPAIKNKFNLEVDIPDFDLSVFKTYLKEIAPDMTLNAKGSFKIKTSEGKYFNLDTTLNNVYYSSEKNPKSINIDEKINIISKFAFEKDTFLIDKLTITGEKINLSSYGKIIKKKNSPVELALNMKLKNSSGKSVLKLVPNKVPALHYALDKAKKYKIDGLLNGEIAISGKPKQIFIDGRMTLTNVYLGYGFDMHPASVKLDFKGDTLTLDGIHYPGYNNNEFVKIKGSIKYIKPIVLNLNILSQPNMELVSVQKALNIYSDLFHFTTGPFPLMTLRNGRGKIDLNIKGTPPDICLNGKLSFWNGTTGFPGLSGVLSNVSGEIDFNGRDISYKNITGVQDGIRPFAYGNTNLKNGGVTRFYLTINDVPLSKAQDFVNKSSMLANVSKALKMIKKPDGTGDLNMLLYIDKHLKEPYVEGNVLVKNASGELDDISYRVKDVNGKVDFNTYRSKINLTAGVNNINSIVKGVASPSYSELEVIIKDADLKAAYEFIDNSPMFNKLKNSYKDFSDLSGKIDAKIKLSGDLASDNPDFYVLVNIGGVKLRYLDLDEDIAVNSGSIKAKKNIISFDNLQGTAFNSPFTFKGYILNPATKNEKRDLSFSIKEFSVSNLNKIIDTGFLPDEPNSVLNKFDYISGDIDILNDIYQNENKIKIKFNDVNMTYKPTNEQAAIPSGELVYNNNSLSLKNVAVQMLNSDFVIDGIVKNYQINPYLDINLISNISEEDFNKNIAYFTNFPLVLNGRMYSNINFTGDKNSWQVKMRAMLDDSSAMFYKNTNIATNFSRFIYVDVEGKDDDININKFQMLAPHNASEGSNYKEVARITGKLKDVYSKNPYIDNLRFKFHDYLSISFLNLVFYDSKNATPVFKEGKIKGDVYVNGHYNDLSVLGETHVKDAVIPSINTVVKDAKIKLKKTGIFFENSLIDIAGSQAVINAELENKFTTPIKIKEINLKSAFFNTDDVMQNFVKLFADKDIETTDDKSERKANKEKETVQKVIPIQPVIIEKGSVFVENIIYNGIAAKDFQADFNINDKWLCNVNNIFAKIFDGQMSGDINYNFYTTDLSGNIEVKHFLANAFATSFLNLPNEFSGYMDANLKFTTTAKTHEKMVENLNGAAYFKLDKGRMLRLGSIEYMLKIANTLKGGVTRLNLNAVVNIVAPKSGYFDTIEGDLKFKNGVIYANKITSRSSQLNLFMRGKYNMNNSIVNAVIIGQMPIESKESILWLGPIGKISLRSLGRQLTRQVSKDDDNEFLQNPAEYLNDIPGLQEKQKQYRFFEVLLDGNLYNEKYVQSFKWIK